MKYTLLSFLLGLALLSTACDNSTAIGRGELTTVNGHLAVTALGCSTCVANCAEDNRLPAEFTTAYGIKTRAEFCAAYVNSCDACIADQSGELKSSNCLLQESMCTYTADTELIVDCDNCTSNCLGDSRIPDSFPKPEMPEKTIEKAAFCTSMGDSCKSCTGVEGDMKCTMSVSTCLYVQKF